MSCHQLWLWNFTPNINPLCSQHQFFLSLFLPACFQTSSMYPHKSFGLHLPYRPPTHLPSFAHSPGTAFISGVSKRLKKRELTKPPIKKEAVENIKVRSRKVASKGGRMRQRKRLRVEQWCGCSLLSSREWEMSVKMEKNRKNGRKRKRTH